MSYNDVVVVGAGPAGLQSAYCAAKEGCKVLVFEKKPEIKDNGCAGGLNSKILKLLNIPEGDWVLNRVKDVEINVDNGETFFVHLKNHNALIIDKTGFLNYLANKAVEKGVEIYLGKDVAKCSTIYTAMEKDSGKVIIDASGYHLNPKYKDTSVCYQYTIKDHNIDGDVIKLWMGWKIAPTGYIWQFPLDSGFARIGIGVCGGFGYNPKKLLDKFIKNNYPKCNVLMRNGGLLPLAKPLDFFVNGNILYAGDRANLCVSATGAGNINALLSGMYAGKTASWYVNGEIDDLSIYDRIIKKQFVKKLVWAYELKENIISDKTYLYKFFRRVKPVFWLHKVFPGLVESFCLKNMRF